jgi:hypothetical protein
MFEMYKNIQIFTNNKNLNLRENNYRGINLFYGSYNDENDINKLYYGCLKEEKNNFDNNNNNLEIIESKNNIDNHANCIDFGRRQLNKDGIEYNYMIYKPQKPVFVDTTTINCYLKCNDEILAVIPYQDYFNINCVDNQKNCILESKESIFNFIKQNTMNCNGIIYLEFIYECENEKIKKSQKIPVDLKNHTKIIVNMNCPIEKGNDLFKSKCEAVFIDNFGINNNQINNFIDYDTKIYECKKPIYKIPQIVNNVNNYKKLKDKISNEEIKNYDSVTIANKNFYIEDLYKDFCKILISSYKMRSLSVK